MNVSPLCNHQAAIHSRFTSAYNSRTKLPAGLPSFNGLWCGSIGKIRISDGLFGILALFSDLQLYQTQVCSERPCILHKFRQGSTYAVYY